VTPASTGEVSVAILGPALPAATGADASADRRRLARIRRWATALSGGALLAVALGLVAFRGG
jgi:hypothetical protein